MKFKIWQVDAFAAKPLEGNPAAIVPLDAWIDPDLMLKIANENNLAETAFFVRKAIGMYELRWFTPQAEVPLCGHATLASAWAIFQFLEPDLKQVDFATKSGVLSVERGSGNRHIMSLPSDGLVDIATPELAGQIGASLNAPPPTQTHKGRYVFAVWNTAADVRQLNGPGDIVSVLRPLGSWGLIATAPGDGGFDFVSRFFAPDKGVPEDPVTGSAHCSLTPYWSKRLGKKHLKARQVSPRGGDLECTDAGERTFLSGPCALYMIGEIEIQ
jgi:PhzF family phenazine biosynthesis protein